MNHSLAVEYDKMKRRHAKLILDGIEIQKENDENLKYYVENRISDPEWVAMLEKAVSSYAIASVRMKVAEAKMEDIRKMLKLD